MTLKRIIWRGGIQTGWCLCQSLVLEAEEQPYEFLLVEGGEQELPSILG